MNKIAIKLLVLSLVATVVIVFFLTKVLNKPSHLLELIPTSAVAVVKVNTRDIAKDVYRYGGFTLDSVASFNDKYPYFKSVKDPRKTGINVYSELFIFQDEVKTGNYKCLLFNLNNLNNFKTFCASNPLLASANEEKSIYYSDRDSFYVWIKEKEAALLFDVQSPNHLAQIMNKLTTQNVKEKGVFKEVLMEGNNVVIWQSQSNTLLKKALPYLAGESEFYGDFKPGYFELFGKTDSQLWEEGKSYLFYPKFYMSKKENKFTFKGKFEVDNKEIHPLSAVLNEWRKSHE